MNSKDSKRNYPSKNYRNKKKNFHIKNLSPAKKFRLRLRLEKFQKRWQSREEYFEHDTRDNVQNKKNNSNARKRKYFNGNNVDKRRAKKAKRASNVPYINIKTEEQKPNVSSKIDNAMSVNAKSIARDVSSQYSEDAKKNCISSSTSSENIAKSCCCHCTCARASKKALRKPRRKLSSPYLGDFDMLQFNNNNHGNCSNTTTKLSVMTTTQQQQHHKYVETNASAGNCSHLLHEQPKLVKYAPHKMNKSKMNGKRLRLKLSS